MELACEFHNDTSCLSIVLNAANSEDDEEDFLDEVRKLHILLLFAVCILYGLV